jgi:hypothetical protein
MSSEIRLIALTCPRCGTPVPAQVDEVAWVCAQCGQGMLLSDEQGTRPLEVFFSAGIAPNAKGSPFWVARGAVRVLSRQTYKGNSSKEMSDFWSVPRLFYVPAYRLPVEEVVAVGIKLLRQPVRMEPGSPAAFHPVVVDPGDVHAIAEFIVMSVEAERKDALKELKVEIKLDPPQLWVLG